MIRGPLASSFGFRHHPFVFRSAAAAKAAIAEETWRAGGFASFCSVIFLYEDNEGNKDTRIAPQSLRTALKEVKAISPRNTRKTRKGLIISVSGIFFASIRVIRGQPLFSCLFVLISGWSFFGESGAQKIAENSC